MSKLVVDISMSLDGLIAGPNAAPENPLGDGGLRLHDWYFKNPDDNHEFARALKSNPPKTSRQASRHMGAGGQNPASRYD
jgi:hypothetical protein